MGLKVVIAVPAVFLCRMVDVHGFAARSQVQVVKLVRETGLVDIQGKLKKGGLYAAA